MGTFGSTPAIVPEPMLRWHFSVGSTLALADTRQELIDMFGVMASGLSGG